MLPSAQRLYASLEAAPWFAKAGMTEKAPVQWAPAWADAAKACSDPAWEQISRLSATMLFEAVVKGLPDGAFNWTKAVVEFQPLVADLLKRKAGEVVKREKLPPVVLSSLAWTVQHALLEAEFSDAVGHGWFGALAVWLVRGHFPCGWVGKWPDGGTLVVL
ncbi:MAG: hypothetical protein K8T20_09065 [Planctomycetes bacterium]|nr:hypothetical protein [Planctomycetota bacterium]